MADERWLFLLDIDNIQGYIFDTNRLKTIIGASWLLDNINSSPEGDTFKILKGVHPLFEKLSSTEIIKHKDFIYSSGGNTVLVFPSKTTAEDFDNKITCNYAAHGISITTHLKKLNGNSDSSQFEYAQNELAHKKYNKTGSESIISSPYFKICEMCGKRYAEKKQEEGIVCEICHDKFCNAKKEFRHLPELTFETNTEKMKNIEGKKITKEMIGLVLIDGNNMGEKIKALNKSPEVFFESLKKFSQTTEKIFTDSFINCIKQQTSDKEIKFLRPLIMGGDDVCFIIDSGEALNFVNKFIGLVEKESKNYNDIYGDGITLSAGILFMKKNYPFNFGYRIAGSLLRSAKKSSRNNNNKSFVDFHFLQSSSGDEIEPTRQREYQHNDCLLTQKPFQAKRVLDILNDAKKLKNCMAKSKIKGHLRRSLRSGWEKSTVEILKVANKMTDKDHQKQFLRIVNKYGWRRIQGDDFINTGLMDLIELTEFFGGEP